MFSNNEISELLKDLNVTEIETISVDGKCCDASSALDASKEGYTVIFPCRYIGVKNSEGFIKKKEQLRNAGVKVIEFVYVDCRKEVLYYE